MRTWLFKTEPLCWSWDDQVRRGARGEEWDGVRNYQARNFMREMELGDQGFFYQTEKERAIVGIDEVCAPSHPDSTTDDPRWDCVDIRAVAALPNPVTLMQIKADPRLSDMALVRQPRLSVQPVTPCAWKIICQMGGYDAG